MYKFCTDSKGGGGVSRQTTGIEQSAGVQTSGQKTTQTHYGIKA